MPAELRKEIIEAKVFIQLTTFNAIKSDSSGGSWGTKQLVADFPTDRLNESGPALLASLFDSVILPFRYQRRFQDASAVQANQVHCPKADDGGWSVDIFGGYMATWLDGSGAAQRDTAFAAAAFTADGPQARKKHPSKMLIGTPTLAWVRSCKKINI